MKKILITGNLGYIDPVVASNLKKERDYNVLGFDTSWNDNTLIVNIQKDGSKKCLSIY